MQNNPKISIITVVYNGEEFLEETVLSVLNQSYKNIEYIIIDGGSTDGTVDIIKKYEDEIDYWVSEADKGIYDAMNKGIDVATGEWINFINAGDKLLHLEEKDLKNNRHTFTNYFYDKAKYRVFRNSLDKFYMTRNMPCHQSIIYKRDEIVKYDVSIKIIADFVQLLEILQKIEKGGKGSSIMYFDTPGVSNMQNLNFKELVQSLNLRNRYICEKLGFMYCMMTKLHKVRYFLKRLLK